MKEVPIEEVAPCIEELLSQVLQGEEIVVVRDNQPIVKIISLHQSAPATESHSTPLTEDPFYGMWENREDMADSSAWVREVRRKHWRQ